MGRDVPWKPLEIPILTLHNPLQTQVHPELPFSIHELGVTHVLVTGGAGYIGSHATLRLLRDFYRVTIVVCLFIMPKAALINLNAFTVNKIFSENKFDAVMHFAAVAYVGESTLDPLKYYHNITSNTLLVLESMAKYGVKKLIYSSTCATYGEPEKMPITEETKQSYHYALQFQKPINPYGKAKKMSKDIILDFSKTSKMTVMILRYFNVIGSDPEGRLARGITTGLKEASFVLSIEEVNHAGDVVAFLADWRMVSPSVVVLVDSEGWADMATTAASSFRRGVVSSLEYYSMILELLDVLTARGGGEWVRRIEMMHVRPKVGWKMEGKDEGERGRKAEKH
ncbi:UDP-arabinose 4-epimerase [Vigna angularis]|uniref:UDP-arabinose 4-epimerase n=1 Tax=Phaseolus angularis TaxID=3914 RepID=A0A8T0LFS5_PHAAN|nr:UDP-arabinose 4-epimerase [Vigna angularis]